MTRRAEVADLHVVVDLIRRYAPWDRVPLLYSNNGCETEKGRNGKEADGNQTLLDTYDIAFQPYSSGWVVVTHYPPDAALQVSTCRDKE